MNPLVGNTIGCLIGIQGCANDHLGGVLMLSQGACDGCQSGSRSAIRNGYGMPSPPTSIPMEGYLSTFHVEVSNT
jgi:hypothetical protein